MGRQKTGRRFGPMLKNEEEVFSVLAPGHDVYKLSWSLSGPHFPPPTSAQVCSVPLPCPLNVVRRRYMFCACPSPALIPSFACCVCYPPARTLYLKLYVYTHSTHQLNTLPPSYHSSTLQKYEQHVHDRAPRDPHGRPLWLHHGSGWRRPGGHYHHPCEMPLRELPLRRDQGSLRLCRTH